MLHVRVRGVMDIVFSVCIGTWSCRCSCMGRMSVSSCNYCMFVCYVYHLAVHNAAFCMTCSLLMLVEDARSDHMEKTCSRTGHMTAL